MKGRESTLGLNNNHHTRKDVQGKKGTVPVPSSSSKSSPKQLFMTLPVMIHFDVSIRCFMGTAMFSLT